MLVDRASLNLCIISQVWYYKARSSSFPHTLHFFFLLKERFHVVQMGLKLYRQLRQPSRIMDVHHHAWQSQIFLNKFLVSPGRNLILSGQGAIS